MTLSIKYYIVERNSYGFINSVIFFASFAIFAPHSWSPFRSSWSRPHLCQSTPQGYIGWREIDPLLTSPSLKLRLKFGKQSNFRGVN